MIQTLGTCRHQETTTGLEDDYFVAVQIIAYERLMSQTAEACRLLYASTLQKKSDIRSVLN